jgi:hypothetical protein
MSFPGLDVEGSVLALIAECPPPEPIGAAFGFISIIGVRDRAATGFVGGPGGNYGGLTFHDITP